MVLLDHGRLYPIRFPFSVSFSPNYSFWGFVGIASTAELRLGLGLTTEIDNIPFRYIYVCHASTLARGGEKLLKIVVCLVVAAFNLQWTIIWMIHEPGKGLFR